MSSDNDEIPRGDLVQALVELAATNERLCRIALAADELVRIVDTIVRKYNMTRPDLLDALRAYKTVRSGS